MIRKYFNKIGEASGDRDNAFRAYRPNVTELNTSSSAMKTVTITATDPRIWAMASVYASAFSGEPWNEIIDVDKQLAVWLRHSENHCARYLIATKGEIVLGGCEFMPLDMFPERREAFHAATYGSLFVNDLFVSPVVQNHGTGSALLEQAEAAAITHGFSHVSLRTHAADFRLCTFYEHRGYVSVCEVPSISGGPLRRVFIKNLVI